MAGKEISKNSALASRIPEIRNHSGHSTIIAGLSLSLYLCLLIIHLQEIPILSAYAAELSLFEILLDLKSI